MEPSILGGSWVVISGVISRVTIVITHVKGLITPLITSHEPPSIPLMNFAHPKVTEKPSSSPVLAINSGGRVLVTSTHSWP